MKEKIKQFIKEHENVISVGAASAVVSIFVYATYKIVDGNLLVGAQRLPDTENGVRQIMLHSKNGKTVMLNEMPDEIQDLKDLKAQEAKAAKAS